jgi:hypothetical protein
MRCEDAIEQISTNGALPGSDLDAAMAHAKECEDCHSALRALDALRPLRHEPPPVPRDRAMERAIDTALSSVPARRYRRGFWSGLAAGAALAATLAAVAVGVWLQSSGGDAPRAMPEVRMALNEPRNVTVTLESLERLVDAEVHVELRGAVALDGYAGQRDLRWMTDLDRGVNELTLPVVALDATGGQVLVEVAHGDKRRAFVLDIRGGNAG